MYYLRLLEMFPWILLCNQTTFSLLPTGKLKNLITTNLIKRLNRLLNKKPLVNLTRIYHSLKQVWVIHRSIDIDIEYVNAHQIRPLVVLQQTNNIRQFMNNIQ